MKKILSIIGTMILMMFFCLPFLITAMAMSLAKISFNDVAARKGEIIEITASLSGCQEIKSMAIVPLYDEERLEYISGEWLIGGALLSDWNQDDKNGVILYSSATDVNGEIAKFSFQLKNSSSWDDIEFSCKVVLKNGESYLDVEVETLKIYIVCDHQWDNELHTHNPTCLEKGYTYYLCTICNREDKMTEIEKIAHTASEWIIDKQSTINEEGLRHKECIVCNEIILEEIIPRLGQCNHIWSDDVFVVEATHSESGKVYRTCEICGEHLKLYDLEKIGLKPWLVAVISVSTGGGSGLIVFLICFFVLLKRKKRAIQ